MKLLATTAILAVSIASPTGQVITERNAPDRNRVEALQHYRLGQQALRGEAFDEAEREFQTAVKLDPLLDLAHYGLGQVYMATKRYPRAVHAYLDCREAFRTTTARTIEDQVLRQRWIDDRIRALEDARQAYQTGLANARTANPYLTVQNFDMQINELRNLRHRNPDHPPDVPAWISLALGSAYFRTDRMGDAEHEFREALRVVPTLGEAHNNLALVCMMTGRYDEAEQEVKAAEKAGFRVNPQFKQDLKNARKGT